MSEYLEPYANGPNRLPATPIQFLARKLGSLIFKSNPDKLTRAERRATAKTEAEQVRCAAVVEQDMKKLGDGFFSKKDIKEIEEFDELQPMDSYDIEQGLRRLYDDGKLICMLKYDNDDRRLTSMIDDKKQSDSDRLGIGNYSRDEYFQLARLPDGSKNDLYTLHEYYALTYEDDENGNPDSRNEKLLLSELNKISGPPIEK